jgi:hypothetical protein
MVVETLRYAVENRDFGEIQMAMQGTIDRLLNSTDPETVFLITPEKREERAVFVDLGGMELLISLLNAPFMALDARNAASETVQKRTEFWNELLVVLREICYALPAVAETKFSVHVIAQLFTMLAHRCIFENCMNLIEELLAVRTETFDMAHVPRLHALIKRFTTRDMAHFCRILALVLFEPEDRQMIESAHTVTGKELLQLRRNRMHRAGRTLESNQALVAAIPDFLEKLVILFKILNHGPDLVDLVRSNIMTQNTPQTEVVRHSSNLNEWDLFPLMLMTCDRVDEENKVKGVDKAEGEETSMAHVLEAFSAQPDQSFEGALRGVLGVATEMGFVTSAIEGINELQFMALSAGLRQHASSSAALSSRGGVAGVRDWTNPPPRKARKLLQFQALMMAQHHVELIFVLCTLLSGRRKIFVQDRLHQLGMSKLLLQLHKKLSWGDPYFNEAMPIEHVHGPGCQCNPESALRIQFLRLVHNFFDRDFVHNDIKRDLLSGEEQRLVDEGADALMTEGRCIKAVDRGLMTHIVSTLCAEGPDSMYRFWLSSCVEAFLRGSHGIYQLLVARNGLLAHVVRHVLNVGARAASNLQAAFDLLGEMLKYNPTNLHLFCASMDEREFKDFMEIAMSNLVDSNVFLRGLLLTLYRLPKAEEASLGPVTPSSTSLASSSSTLATKKSVRSRQRYLSHSWCLFRPGRKHIQPACSYGIAADAEKAVAADAAAAVDRAAERARAAAPVETVEAWVDKITPSKKKGTAATVSELSPQPPSMALDSQLRLLVFVDNKRDQCLISLIESVSIHTITNENICCLNTSILICVVEALRNRLPLLLSRVNDYVTKHMGPSSTKSTPVKGRSDSPEGQGSPRGSPSTYRHIIDEHGADAMSDNAWFRNFRELLWYWQEYYMRRGRDRLSLEFSSNIPFHVWRAVVSDLCADDGSESALLHAPIQLPLSSYHAPPSIVRPRAVH